ncbi:SDR family oxidoreductase [Archangium primigenium]|uniref:SDR family oxidoreductase n=1 Tax=[Archangium] primigenium TaxID=2792470 RepID=UPI00195C5EEA|nr:SDR family oxidoreductase [Archangium primigenium]MBM7119389.1 SDR family oxidoreductase [Archangium primigenium]
MTTVLVTGATGTIGSQVVAALKGREDVKVRAAVRSAAKADALRGGGVVPVDFEFTKPELIKKALTGVEKVFLVVPFTAEQVEHATKFIDLAKEAGVRHVVKLSALGCEYVPGIDLGRWHRIVERYLEGSGLAHTFLRPTNFMENFIHFNPPGKDGNIYLPFGQAGCSFIAGADIAAVAAAALTTPGHEGQAYDLVGPEALTVAQVAEQIASVAGRPVKYVDVPEEAARQGMVGAGMPGWSADAMLQLYGLIKAGHAARVTDTVQKITGRAPTTFAEFAKKHAASWK